MLKELKLNFEINKLTIGERIYTKSVLEKELERIIKIEKRGFLLKERTTKALTGIEYDKIIGTVIDFRFEDDSLFISANFLDEKLINIDYFSIASLGGVNKDTREVLSQGFVILCFYLVPTTQEKEFLFYTEKNEDNDKECEVEESEGI